MICSRLATDRVPLLPAPIRGAGICCSRSTNGRCSAGDRRYFFPAVPRIRLLRCSPAPRHCNSRSFASATRLVDRAAARGVPKNDLTAETLFTSLFQAVAGGAEQMARRRQCRTCRPRRLALGTAGPTQRIALLRHSRIFRRQQAAASPPEPASSLYRPAHVTLVAGVRFVGPAAELRRALHVPSDGTENIAGEIAGASVCRRHPSSFKTAPSVRGRALCRCARETAISIIRSTKGRKSTRLP